MNKSFVIRWRKGENSVQETVVESSAFEIFLTWLQYHVGAVIITVKEA